MVGALQIKLPQNWIISVRKSFYLVSLRSRSVFSSKSSLLVNNQDKNLTAAPYQEDGSLQYTCGGEISGESCSGSNDQGSCSGNIPCNLSSAVFFY